jgi:hypothetical protein
MKLVIILTAVAGIGLCVPASAQDAHVGVGVGPIGAGVSVGDHDRYREHYRERTVIRREEPRERTVVIKKEHEEPREKTIIKDRY